MELEFKRCYLKVDLGSNTFSFAKAANRKGGDAVGIWTKHPKCSPKLGVLRKYGWERGAH